MSDESNKASQEEKEEGVLVNFHKAYYPLTVQIPAKLSKTLNLDKRMRFTKASKDRYPQELLDWLITNPLIKNKLTKTTIGQVKE